MTCGKHSGQMADWATDAALGQLRPAQEAELLAHIGECDACREGYRHAREVAATVDRGVEDLVAGEPSSYFAARFRARAAAECVTPRSNWVAWTPIAAGALALLVLVAILWGRSLDHSGSMAPAAVEVNAPIPDVVNAAQPQSLRGALANSQRGRGPQAQGRQGFPEVLVPGDQLVAALQLSNAVSGGHLDAEQIMADRDEVAEPLDVRPIEIIPLEYSELNPSADDPSRF